MALVASGCLGPKLESRRIASEEQEGIRYSLPRPHLFVSRGSTHPPQIVYLPDRCNQYGLTVSRGIGTLETEIELEDGWNLTRVGLATDSKTPETVAAIGEPVAEIGKALARETGAADLEVTLYDLVTGACVFAWPSRAECAAPAACPARE
jgi:hypothetical protein